MASSPSPATAVVSLPSFCTRVLDGFAVEFFGVQKLLELAEIGHDFLDAFVVVLGEVVFPAFDVLGGFFDREGLGALLDALMVVVKRVVGISLSSRCCLLR